MNWWELTVSEILDDPEALEEANLAYINTFCLTPHGKQVFAHLRSLCWGDKFVDKVTTEFAVGALMLVELFGDIRRLCGITDNKAVCDAEAAIALRSDVEVQEQEEPDLLRTD